MTPVDTSSVSASGGDASEPHARRYWPALDGMRGLACLMVMAFHESRRLKGGFLGVDVFFVLSGFLITSILLDEWTATRSVSLKRFYARRVLRLAPALCVFVAAMALQRGVPIPAEIGPMRWQWAAFAVTYVSDLVIAYGYVFPLSIVTHCWSLGVEEQFYIVWPVVLTVALRRGVRLQVVLGGVVAAIVVCAVARQALVLLRHGDPHLLLRVYYAPDTRADVLLTGCALGLLRGLRVRAPSPLGASVLAAAAVMVLAYFARTQSMGDMVAHPFGFSVVALAAAALVMASWTPSWLSPFLEARPIVWLGKLSYSLYLWHVFAFMFGRHLGLFPFEPPDVAIMYLIAIGFGAGSYYLVERPFLRLKERWASTPRASSVGGG